MVTRLEGNQWKLEEEKRLLEEQIKKDRQNMNTLSLPLPPATQLHSNLLQEVCCYGVSRGMQCYNLRCNWVFNND